MTAKYRPGEVVRIKSNEDGFGGAQEHLDRDVIVDRYDPTDDSWLVRLPVDTENYGAFWVGQRDLEQVGDNEKELDKQARQLLGVEPNPHCTTCTCYSE